MEEQIKQYEKYISLLEQHNELLEKTIEVKDEQIRILQSIVDDYEQENAR